MLEYVGSQQVRWTPSVVLASLEELGQGQVGLRARGLKEVELGRGLEGSVDCSPPLPSDLLAWALAAASC